MRLEKVQEVLKERRIRYEYAEEDGCGSIDFYNKGLPYHIWEFADKEEWGVETNIFHVGRSVEITGDYEKELAEELKNWMPG